MNTLQQKTPEHESVYQKIRDMILFGEFEPGQPVTILGLRARLAAGSTPIREAIRRLTAEGALEALGNRRVCVPVMTRQRLNEIRVAREAIEPELAERAAQNMTPQTVKELREVDRLLDASIEAGDPKGYLRWNYAFHFLLYDAADSLVLTRIARSLWLQVAPSLRIMSGRLGTVNLPDKHSEAIDALEAMDAQVVRRVISEDIQQGMHNISELLPESEFDQIV